MTDCQGQTVWSLNNACTRALAKLKPYPQHLRATGIGEPFKRQPLKGDSLYERSQADVAEHAPSTYPRAGILPALFLYTKHRRKRL